MWLLGLSSVRSWLLLASLTRDESLVLPSLTHSNVAAAECVVMAAAECVVMATGVIKCLVMGAEIVEGGHRSIPACWDWLWVDGATGQ
jgi:hypothetical protein